MPRAAGGPRRSEGVGYISSTPRMFTHPCCSTKLRAAPHSLPGEFQHWITFTKRNITGTKIIWWVIQMLKFVNKTQMGWVMRTSFVCDLGHRYSYSQLLRDLQSNRGNLNAVMLVFIGTIKAVCAHPFFYILVAESITILSCSNATPDLSPLTLWSISTV